MSTALPGAPIGPDIEPGGRQVRFDHIPKLRELLKNGGWPGVTYAQCLVRNLKAAADRTDRPANLRPIRGAFYYSITTAKGEAQMALVGCGKPIPGAAPEAGERLFFTDGEVEDVTGLAVEYPIYFSYRDVGSVADVATETPVYRPLVAEPPRVKRKYTRRGTKRHKGGRYSSAESTKGKEDGSRQEEPGPEAS